MFEILLIIFIVLIVGIAGLIGYAIGYNAKNKVDPADNTIETKFNAMKYSLSSNKGSRADWKLKVDLDPQPEGGYTVTCDELPELITEGDTLEEVIANVKDCFFSVMEAYDELGRLLPDTIKTRIDSQNNNRIWLELDIENTKKESS